LMTDQELLQKLDRLKAVMIAVATGGPRIGDVEAEFTRDYDAFDAELARRNFENPLPYRIYGNGTAGGAAVICHRGSLAGNLYMISSETLLSEFAYSIAAKRPLHQRGGPVLIETLPRCESVSKQP
jgi:hypothetical protein